MQDYLLSLKSLFKQHSDPDAAAPMKRYMRDQFEFFGIKTPERKAIFRRFVAEVGLPRASRLESIIRELWDLPQREYQYAAMDLLDESRRVLAPEAVALLEQLIVSKSWWDTVDGLATRTIGGLFARHPRSREVQITRWRQSDNLWLRRTTLLFQLKYKEETDERLLFSLIRDQADSKEFFIQKAIGWGLREYSKTNEEAVRSFVGQTRLAPLSRREALKWSNKSCGMPTN